MHYQYPLETLARRRGTAAQLDFAKEAVRAFLDSDEVLFEPHGHGLAILAAHEAALAEPSRVLRELYGDFVELRGPKVRYIPGEPPQQPMMHARISSRPEHSLRILAELRARDARILEHTMRPRVCIVRAEAPLASLLGLPDKLEALAGGEVVHAIRLMGYAPLEPAPEPGPVSA